MRVVIRWLLILVIVVGLGIDAYTHFDLAKEYQFNKTSTISEATLFRAEAVVAILAGLAVLIRPNRLTAAIAFLVAGGGLALLVLYRYVDVGKIGPLPDMYDPLWFFKKTLSALGELGAAVAALALVLVSGPVTRRPKY